MRMLTVIATRDELTRRLYIGEKVPLPAKNLAIAVCTMVLLATARDSAQAQQHGMHGPRWGFAAATTASKGVLHPRLTRTWNPSDNLDSVWIVMGRSRTAPVDSIRLSIKAGPSHLAYEENLIAATYRSDSLGQWVTLPSSLLRPGRGERNVPMPMRVIGVFSPTTIASWARSQNPNHPVVTRIAADVWRRKTYERAELYLEPPTVDTKTKPIVAPRKPSPVKPVKN